MTDAPRYRLVGYDIGTAPDENGGWVHWTDHEAEIARLTTERDAAMAGAWTLGRDAAAAWHTMQAETAMGALCCGSDNYEIRRARRVSDMHRGHSEAIRALTPPADLAAKIGGE